MFAPVATFEPFENKRLNWRFRRQLLSSASVALAAFGRPVQSFDDAITGAKRHQSLNSANRTNQAGNARNPRALTTASDDGEVIVNFDGRTVTYGFGELDTLVPAHAATIHKSQGSEYPAVAIPIMTQHYALLQRNLLYTGATRGRKLVVLVGRRTLSPLRFAMFRGDGGRRNCMSGCVPTRPSQSSVDVAA
jgi:hypothetical protein